jgi:DNA-binding NarL/FixJ family response regulator
MGQGPATVVIVVDHFALRKGIEALLRKEGHHVVGWAGDVQTARAVIEGRQPDLVILDAQVRGGSGGNLAAELVAEAPRSKVLLYPGGVDLAGIRKALSGAAAGALVKTAGLDETRKAVATVLAGGTYLDPQIRALLDEVRRPAERILSPREAEVLRLLANGLTGPAIARRLFISPETVRTHVRNAMGKLGATTRVQAVTIALGKGELQDLEEDPGRKGR